MSKRKLSAGESSGESDCEVVSSAKSAQLRELKEEERRLYKEKALKSFSILIKVSSRFSALCDEKLKSLQREKESGANTGDDSLDTNKLKYFSGELKPHQHEGVAWMKRLFLGGMNGILADEMGLGKTVQMIALLAHLVEVNCRGPFLIIVPLPTVGNWSFELKRFAPELPYVILHGTKEERQNLKVLAMKTHLVGDVRVRPILIVNFETALNEISFLQATAWNYLIVDEAQRIKNHESKMGIALRTLNCGNKMLLTGTPLQNNLTELWALLNFIMPSIFSQVDSFSSLFILEDMEDRNIVKDSTETGEIASAIHQLLAPFMLRRLKIDVLDDLPPKKEVLVYCPLTLEQKKIYSSMLKKSIELANAEEKQVEEPLDYIRTKRLCSLRKSYVNNDDIDEILDNDEFEDSLITMYAAGTQNVVKKQVPKETGFFDRIKMNNMPMMFRKIVNHPYLVHAPLDPKQAMTILVDEQLINSSGKMLVLDAMLSKLHAGGHKVLIFSTLTIMLNLIEDYMVLRNYEYRRLDGKTNLEYKQKYIDEFNSDPEIFVFLISTRAGSLGINLASADTVIFYDRDWNPQVDVQAQDRCHRIGQTRPVMVYTLVTKNTIDEKVLETGKKKMRLEKLVIKHGKFGENKADANQVMVTLLKMLEDDHSDNVIHPNGYIFTNSELDSLLDRKQLIQEYANIKIAKLKKIKQAERKRLLAKKGEQASSSGEQSERASSSLEKENRRGSIKGNVTSSTLTKTVESSLPIRKSGRTSLPNKKYLEIFEMKDKKTSSQLPNRQTSSSPERSVLAETRKQM